MEMRSFVRTAQGIATVARRRGVGYLGYLLSGVAWPQAAYRFAWGPTAPPLLQGVFAAAGELTAAKPDRTELEQLRLVAPEGAGIAVTDPGPEEVEELMNRAHAAG